MTRKESDASIA